MVDEHLGLVFQSTERTTMDDAVAITLEFGAIARRRFRMLASRLLRLCAA